MLNVLSMIGVAADAVLEFKPVALEAAAVPLTIRSKRNCGGKLELLIVFTTELA